NSVHECCLSQVASIHHAAAELLSLAAPDNLQPIDWKPFLNRPIFTVCPSDCHSLFAGKTVLITGAAGSIGSALALFMMEGFEDRLVLLDRSEQKINQLYRKYRERNLTLPTVDFIHADICCQDTLEEV